MLSVSAVFLILIAALLVHLAEEIVTGFTVNFIFGEIPKPIFISINVIIYSYAILTFYLLFHKEKIALILIWVFVIIQFLNVIGHIGFMLKKKRYFPGGYTTVLLLIILLYFVYILV